MNDVQTLMPGLWFYHEKSNDPFYIGSSTNLTANLLRKVIVSGKEMTASHHTLYTNLIPIPLDEDILIDNFGFLTTCRDGYACKEIIPALDVLRGDTMERIKHPTYILVECDNTKRKTVYLECGESKVFLPEISYVHELQHLIYSLTWKFHYITINKTKQDD